MKKVRCLRILGDLRSCSRAASLILTAVRLRRCEPAWIPTCALASSFTPRSRQDGCTPLHLAVFKGSVPLVEMLLRSRADPTLTTRNNLSALDLARQNGFEALARRLQSESST